jgi:hypothetical protein
MTWCVQIIHTIALFDYIGNDGDFQKEIEIQESYFLLITRETTSQLPQRYVGEVAKMDFKPKKIKVKLCFWKFDVSPMI